MDLLLARALARILKNQMDLALIMETRELGHSGEFMDLMLETETVIKDIGIEASSDSTISLMEFKIKILQESLRELLKIINDHGGKNIIAHATIITKAMRVSEQDQL